MPRWLSFNEWGFPLALFLIDIPLVAYWWFVTGGFA
jgi:hypothetical protein